MIQKAEPEEINSCPRNYECLSKDSPLWSLFQAGVIENCLVGVTFNCAYINCLKRGTKECYLIQSLHSKKDIVRAIGLYNDPQVLNEKIAECPVFDDEENSHLIKSTDANKNIHDFKA